MKSNYLYNPFIKIAGFKSLILGLIGFVIVTYLAFKTGTHFNGLLNIDFARDSAYHVFLTENLLNWICISFFMYISGLIFSQSKIRIVDVLGTTLLSRIPLIIAPAIRTIPIFQSFMFQSWQMYFIISFYMISLAWTIVLLFNAFKISCNLKNEKLIILFIICFLLSDICTKLIIKLII
jgi:hypothetical protein